MPQTRQDPGHQDVEQASGGHSFPAAQRVEDVVANPEREADVPPRPEGRNTGRKVGEVEVESEVVAEQPSCGDGHVRVAGEVAVNLRGPQPDGQITAAHAVFGMACEVFIDELRHTIRDDGLLDKADEEQDKAATNIYPGEIALRDALRKEVLRAHDGPGHQLRKEGNKEREIEDVLRRFELPAVDVDGVAERLECVETDSHRQGDVEDIHRDVETQQVRHIDGRLDEEVEVLEDAQQAQVADKAGSQEPETLPLVVCLDQLISDDVVEQRREEDQRQKAPVPRGIEDVAGEKQPELASPIGLQRPMDTEHREEERDESELGENQRSASREVVRTDSI